MSFKKITGLIAALAFAAVAVNWTISDASAGWGWGGGKKVIDQTGCSLCCPACKHVCKLDAKEVEEDKTCFEVECKVICIPRVVFPWQKKKCNACDSCDGQGCNAGVHNGARTRTIRVLKTKDYTCPKCEYKWSSEPCGGCDGCCDDGCDGCCDATVGTAVPYITPMHSTPVEMAPPTAQPVIVEPVTSDLPAPKN